MIYHNEHKKREKKHKEILYNRNIYISLFLNNINYNCHNNSKSILSMIQN